MTLYLNPAIIGHAEQSVREMGCHAESVLSMIAASAPLSQETGKLAEAWEAYERDDSCS